MMSAAEPHVSQQGGGGGVPTASRGMSGVAAAFLFLAVLPDSMVVPVLSELFVDRFGVTAARAHWFMAINVIGGVCVLPLLAVLRRRLSIPVLLSGAAAINAVLLAIMAGPVTFAAILTLRFFEGAADLIVFALLFNAINQAGTSRRRGVRLGMGGTVLMLALGVGVMLGGQIGAVRPTNVFIVGSGLCVLLAAIATQSGRWLTPGRSSHSISRSAMSPRRSAESTDPPNQAMSERAARRRLWPALMMIFSDRAVGGLLVVTLPFYFATVWKIDPAMRSWLIGTPLLLMAGGAWPMGWLGDRIGHLRLRTCSAIVYAGALAMLPWMTGWPLAALFSAMAMLGAGGAALLPTSLTFAGRSGLGSVAMGCHRVSGEIGYLLGLAAAGGMLAVFGGEDPASNVYHLVIVCFAAVHGVFTAIAWFGQSRCNRDVASDGQIGR